MLLVPHCRPSSDRSSYQTLTTAMFSCCQHRHQRRWQPSCWQQPYRQLMNMARHPLLSVYTSVHTYITQLHTYRYTQTRTYSVSHQNRILPLKRWNLTPKLTITITQQVNNVNFNVSRLWEKLILSCMCHNGWPPSCPFHQRNKVVLCVFTVFSYFINNRS